MNFFEDQARAILLHADKLQKQVKDVDWRTRSKVDLEVSIIKMIANDIINGPQEPKCTCLPGSQFVQNSAEDLAAIAMCQIHSPKILP